MMRKSLLLVLYLGWLSGCEHTAEPIVQQPEPVQTPLATLESELVSELEFVEPAAPVKAVEGTPEALVKAPDALVVAQQPKPIKSESRLDLSVPKELFEQALEGETHKGPSPLLPPLFDEKSGVEGPFQISGRLISNERVDDYWDSIEGAEVQFKFKH